MEQWCTGLQHVGIPTKNLAASLAFYKKLGFAVSHENRAGENEVRFVRLGTLELELYENNQPAGAPGSIDHIAINTQNVDACYGKAKHLGCKVVSDGIESLPFFANGCRYFIIEGPNGERLEFNQADQ